jgi:cytochrome c-type biogenesis protein CcmE
MTRKRRRLWILIGCGLGLGVAATATLLALNDSMQLFVSPSSIAAMAARSDRTFRLGGLVQQGSLEFTERDHEPLARFRVTDGAATVTVTYAGILPDLFREGQGIVALGTLQTDGTFKAQEVLAKHDETYMPKEVADALKKSGHWNPSQGAPPPAATWNTLEPKRGG